MAFYVRHYEPGTHSSGVQTIAGVDATGCDKLVALITVRDITTGDRPVSSVTRDGQNFTQVPGAVGDQTNQRVEVWYLDNPNTGTADVAVTHGGALGFSATAVVCLAGTVDGAPVDDATDVINGGTIPTASLTTAADAILFGVGVHEATSGVTLGTDQTFLLHQTANRTRWASYKEVASGSHTMTCTIASSVRYTYAGVAFTGGPPPLPVDDAVHLHTADNVTLTQNHVLVVADAAHAHVADNVVLGVATQLEVDDAAHLHTADNLTLVENVQLAVDDSVHLHAADNVVLSTSDALGVDSAFHLHAADQVTLVQAHVLAVDGTFHLHTVDNVRLRGAASALRLRVRSREPSITAGSAENPTRVTTVRHGRDTTSSEPPTRITTEVQAT